jgi:hypothetical protein
MLGAYYFPKISPISTSDDPRMARLRRAWNAWEYIGQDGGTLVRPKGIGASMHFSAHDTVDGLQWYPPDQFPSLYDLARADMPQPATRVHLRRIGPVSVPLGIGPVFGAGSKRGQPSSPLGILAAELFTSASDKERAWTTADEKKVEQLLFFALQAGYHLTEELFAELAPYDLDEIPVLLGCIWGNDPKASASDGPTSPPSPQA